MINLDNLGKTNVTDISYRGFVFLQTISRNGNYFQIYNKQGDYGLLSKGYSIKECKSIVDTYIGNILSVVI